MLAELIKHEGQEVTVQFTVKLTGAIMDDEQAFFEVLENTAYFSITEESLTLFSANKQPVARFAAIYF